MTKEIKIGSCIYKVQYSQEVANLILDEILKWMSEDKHYAAYSGEGIMQSDDTLIDAPELISNIVDNFLKPEFIRESD